jgi:hypothetical protein
MKLLEKIGSGVMKKVGLATALMGGFLAFVGARPGFGASACGGWSAR